MIRGINKLQRITEFGQGEVMCASFARLLSEGSRDKWDIFVCSKDADSIISHLPVVASQAREGVRMCSVLLKRPSSSIFGGGEFPVKVNVLMEFRRFDLGLKRIGLKGGWLDLAVAYSFIVNDVLARTKVTLHQFMSSLIVIYSQNSQASTLGTVSSSFDKGILLNVGAVLETLQHIWCSKLKNRVEVTEKLELRSLEYLRALDWMCVTKLGIPDEMELMLRLSQVQFVLHHHHSVLLLPPSRRNHFGTFDYVGNVCPFEIRLDSKGSVESVEPLCEIPLERAHHYFAEKKRRKSLPEDYLYTNILHTRLSTIALLRNWSVSRKCTTVKNMVRYCLDKHDGRVPVSKVYRVRVYIFECENVIHVTYFYHELASPKSLQP